MVTGMQSCVGQRWLAGGEQTLGQFALVAYIPDPLARFLDDLRKELTPGCNPHAHVTILPPRPIHDELKETLRQIVDEIRRTQPFWVELGDIEVFATSQVIYAGLSKGMPELRNLYRALNSRNLKYAETFPYHPHITIGQNMPAGNVESLAEVARKRWAEYEGPRGFTVSVLSFVQHVAPSIWADVAALPLGVEVPAGR
jgi:2'-5' RNA ligase